EAACADTWRNIRHDLKRIKLAQLLSPTGTVWQLTEPPTDALKQLKSLKIKNPPPAPSDRLTLCVQGWFRQHL
ncbi:MAG: hypothetical protein ACREYE_31370, partial [Gammaproteobacteria bacterium]